MRFFSLVLLILMGCASVTKEPSDADINARAKKAFDEVKSKSKISTNAESPCKLFCLKLDSVIREPNSESARIEKK